MLFIFQVFTLCCLPEYNGFGFYCFQSIIVSELNNFEGTVIAPFTKLYGNILMVNKIN